MTNPMTEERTLRRIERLAREIEELRVEHLFEGDGAIDNSPVAAQHVLLALSSMEQAVCHMKLATHHLPSTKREETTVWEALTVGNLRESLVGVEDWRLVHVRCDDRGDTMPAVHASVVTPPETHSPSKFVIVCVE